MWSVYISSLKFALYTSLWLILPCKNNTSHVVKFCCQTVASRLAVQRPGEAVREASVILWHAYSFYWYCHDYSATLLYDTPNCNYWLSWIWKIITHKRHLCPRKTTILPFIEVGKTLAFQPNTTQRWLPALLFCGFFSWSVQASMNHCHVCKWKMETPTL